MAILANVPGKPDMCLQENLADCVDCGGLVIPVHFYIKVTKVSYRLPRFSQFRFSEL